MWCGASASSAIAFRACFTTDFLPVFAYSSQKVG